jgi:hypothetical protein
VRGGNFPCLSPSLARTKEEKHMEDEKKEELEEETDTEEASPEDQKIESEESEEGSEEAKEENKDIDFKKEFEELESKSKPKSELEKAQKALFFNAERLKELGGDPAEVLKIKPQEKQENGDDVKSLVSREFKERDARTLARGNEDLYKVIMWYVDNRKLDVDEAYLLANKGRIMRTVTEAKRAAVDYGKPDSGGRKIEKQTIPDRSPEDKAVLERRGLRFNPKTQSYQGKFTEEYYDTAEGTWKSRKLKR